MSKSDPSDFSRINLCDDKDLIINKIKKSKTDTLPMPDQNDDLEKRPEVLNLLGIYSSLSNQNLGKVKSEFEGKNFSSFKDNLSELLVGKIEPIGKKIKDLLKDEKYLDKILEKGSEKADNLSSKKITEMKTLVGF
jgi:tryptophanyl-tRNA synthetase